MHAAPPLLIAGCGDVGSRLARRLQARGRSVLCLRRNPAVLPPDLPGCAGDLADRASLQGLPRGIREVVFLPAPAARDEAAYRAVYLHGLANLLDVLAAGALGRVLLVGSSAVYGEHGGEWVDEDTVPAPLGSNGTVLLQAEQLLAERLPAGVGVVLRLAGLYGPGRMHVLDALRAGRARVPREVPFYANRIHVDDAAAALEHLLQLPQPQACYLGVDDHPLPLHVLYDTLARHLGLPPPPPGPPPSGIGNKRLRNARLRASGWTPQWPDALAGHLAALQAAP